MNLKEASTRILDQLSDLTSNISENDYCTPIESLSRSTIGQHLRHTLEFFLCLQHGFSDGVVNYDKRQHEKLIESDKYIALATINRIKDFIATQQVDKVLKLEVGYDQSDEFFSMNTNYMRELVYNIEHAVHHMALIKIGIREAASYVEIPADFGIAASTIRYKESLKSASH